MSGIDTPRTREKLDTREPTLLISSLVYLVLFLCSLQTSSVFRFYEVDISQREDLVVVILFYSLHKLI
jgi:hypothetical protein